MHVSRVSPTFIKPDRLDAVFYDPDYMEVERILSNTEHVPLGGCGRLFAGPFGSKLPSNIYFDEGVPLFRVGNIGQLELLTENLAHIEETVHADIKASEVVPGDLLIVKASVGEKICRVPDHINKANITQHIIGLRSNSTIDADYISAFLFSDYGRKQLERYSLGSIIQYLGVNDARKVLIFCPKEKAQEYIGGKLKLAQRLRRWAKGMEVDFSSQMEFSFSSAFHGHEDAKIYSRVSAWDLSIDLNPGLFAPERIRIRTALLKEGGVKLSSVAKVDSSATDSYSSNSSYLGLDGILSTDSTLVFSTVGSDGIVGLQRKLLAGPVISKLRPYLNKVAYVPEDCPSSVGSTELLNVVPKSSDAGWFIYGALKQVTTIKQLNPIATGATHPRVSGSDILDLVIPWFDNVKEIGVGLKEAFRARQLAIHLVSCAKFLVEALIKGQLSESELVNAYESLEGGNDTLDRSILSRVTTNGVDGGGAPLFPHLDQLYDLLEKSGQELEA